RFVMDGWGGSNISCFFFLLMMKFKWLLPDWFAGYVKLWLLLDGFEVLVVLIDFLLASFIYVICLFVLSLLLASWELGYGDGSVGA
ncbi:hypothetical protein Tco_1248250, partial [Tanacetum coccineum]